MAKAERNDSFSCHCERSEVIFLQSSPTPPLHKEGKARLLCVKGAGNKVA